MPKILSSLYDICLLQLKRLYFQIQVSSITHPVSDTMHSLNSFLIHLYAASVCMVSQSPGYTNNGGGFNQLNKLSSAFSWIGFHGRNFFLCFSACRLSNSYNGFANLLKLGMDCQKYQSNH